MTVPIYEFRCADCGGEHEVLLPLGESGPRPCPDCDGQLRRRFSRVGVRFGTWGFASTDGLVDRPGRRDFATLRERAEQIRDS